ncbi:MAG: diaminopimelate dehydrogenase [Alphaproteobacteria bacterium]|nr:diaminopimelate dehydrogenase [Alphaproteobacteria bacterium]
MQRINVAIIGWGNVGRGCKRAIEESKDIVLTGVVRRPASLLKNLDELKNTTVVSDIQELDKVDVALLCVPSREVPEKMKMYQKLGICTVDSYDEHEHILDLKQDGDLSAKINKVVSMTACGWDPGTDSVVRALMKMVAITGKTTTTFGGEKGGRSMGHTVAVKAIPGVKDAVALTLANGRGKHKRRVYVVLEKDANEQKVAAAIQKDPYFKQDPTEVLFVKDINKYNTLHHEGDIERTAMEVHQQYTVSGDNPDFTANVMVSCARACINAMAKEEYGCYTLIERPLIDCLFGATLEEKLAGY